MPSNISSQSTPTEALLSGQGLIWLSEILTQSRMRKKTNPRSLEALTTSVGMSWGRTQTPQTEHVARAASFSRK